MLAADGRYVLTFNGEIYNYKDLRQQLQSLGYQFRTDSDAEVLLAAFVEWDTGCVNRLNGMFAFGIWDNQKRCLTLVRDHVGIKPLYYTAVSPANGRPARFAFASEIRAFSRRES